MSSVDNRIVDMQFNNKQFESGIQSSIKSLDSLKSGLNLDASAKSLSNLDKIGRAFTLAGISEGVDTLTRKFSALGIIGITTLQNITNSAVNAGKKLLSSLTIDPIKTGLQEYETKMGAIQTILTNTASKGTTLEDVNKTLNELNEYSDKTIYNFAEMAKNIGTFTAAGIELEASATAIKGIANLAAGSGSTSLQASTAMYQLSQALASGTVRLQDWNSVVNAGMGGELFQNALKATAKEMGVVIDTTIPFRESLQDGWLSAEVLTKTLARFAEDESLILAATQVKTFTQLLDTMKESVQSGWAQSWENIIGNKDEAAKLFTAINDAFGSIVGTSAIARNEMLAFWKANEGRDAVITGLSNSFVALQAVIKPIKEAFSELFPAMTGERLVEISNAFSSVTEKFKIGEQTADELKRTFKGLFAVLDIGKQLFVSLVNVVGIFLTSLAPVGKGLLGFTARIGDFLVALDESIKTTNIFNSNIEKTATFLKNVATNIVDAISKIISSFDVFKNVDMTGLDTFTERVQVRFEPFTKLGDFIQGVFSTMAVAIQKAAPIFFSLATLIGKALDKVREKVVESLDNAEYNSIFDIINSGIFVTILVGLKKFIDSLTDIADNAGGFLSGITGILDGVKGSLEAYQSQLKAGTLLKIATAIGILAASLVVLSLIDSDKLTVALGAISVMFIELFASMALFERLAGGTGIVSMVKLTTVMLGLSVSILLLSFAMEKLSKIDSEGIANGLISIAALSAILVASAKLLSGSANQLTTSALGFILFATAINILVNAVDKLSAIDGDKLVNGLLGVGVVIAELIVFMKTANMTKLGISTGIGLVALSFAIVILADAVKRFSTIDVADLLKGLAAVAIVLAELAIFVKLTGNVKHVISTAIGLTILGAAMLIFAEAITRMADLSWEQVAKGIITMAGALSIIVIALNFMPKNMILIGAGLVIIAESLVILSTALNSMGSMSWEEIAKGLVTLAGSLGIIAGAMYLMTSALPGAAALIVIAGALAILAPVILSLGNMSWEEIGKGLLTLAGAFAIIGVAGLVLAPITPVLIALAGSIALLGLSVAAIGGGMLAFSAGLAALAISGTAGVAALVLLITSVVGLIPFIFTTLAQAIVDFAQVIGNSGPVLAEAVTSIILALIAAVLIIIPAVTDTFLTLVLSMLNVLLDHVPDMVNTGLKLLTGFLAGVRDNIKDVVKTAIEIVLQFIAAIAEMLPGVIQAGIDLILAFINGLAEALRGNTEPMINAIKNLVSAIIESAIKVLLAAIPTFLNMGKLILDNGIIKGVQNRISSFLSTIGEIPTKGIAALRNSLGGFTNAGGFVIDGFIGGIKSKITEAAKWAANLASAVLSSAKKVLGIESPSKEFLKIGMYSNQGLANGLRKYVGLVSDESENVGNTAKRSLSDSLSNVSDIVSGDLNMQPIIKPVLDLTDVIDGNSRLSSLFAKNPTVTTTNKSVELAGEINTKQNVTTTAMDAVNKLLDKVNQAIEDLKQAQPNIDQWSFENVVIREEADIRKLAREMEDMRIAGQRG